MGDSLLEVLSLWGLTGESSLMGDFLVVGLGTFPGAEIFVADLSLEKSQNFSLQALTDQESAGSMKWLSAVLVAKSRLPASILAASMQAFLFEEACFGVGKEISKDLEVCWTDV